MNSRPVMPSKTLQVKLSKVGAVNFLALFFMVCFLFNAEATNADNRSIGDVGTVTIDGEVIPEAYYRIYVSNLIYAPELTCTPHSDAFFRDQVVNALLREKEYRASSLQLPQKALDRIVSQEKKLTDTDKTDTEQYLLNELSLKKTISVAIVSVQYGENTPEKIIDHYSHMIKAKHPAVTNVVVLRRYVLEVGSSEEVELVQDFIDSGRPFSTLINAQPELEFDFAGTNIWSNLNSHKKYQADLWYTLANLTHYRGDGHELKAGDVLGPFKTDFDTQFVYIEEQKVLSRLRPNQMMNGDYKHTRTLAKKELENERRYGLNDSQLATLWQKYSVELNGEALERTSSYPVCP